MEAGFLTKTSGNPPKQHQASDDHEHAKKPDLPILQLQELFKQASPPQWRDHGHQALQDEHEAQSQQEGLTQGLLPGRSASACRAAHGLEKVRAGRVEHHHIRLAGKGGFVGLQAPIELRKLRIFAKSF